MTAYRQLKTQISTLTLTPFDIVVVTVAKASKIQVRIMAAELKKCLPPGQKAIILGEGVKLDVLANLLKPEDIHHISMIQEQRLLAAATPLPMQRAAKKKSRR